MSMSLVFPPPVLFWTMGVVLGEFGFRFSSVFPPMSFSGPWAWVLVNSDSDCGAFKRKETEFSRKNLCPDTTHPSYIARETSGRIISRTFAVLRIRDPHFSWKLDPDPEKSEKVGSSSALQSKFRRFLGSKWSCEGPWMLTMEAWRIKMEPGRSVVDQWSQIRITLMRSKIRIRIHINVKSWIRIRF
jgi:hypothetical protein